MMETAQPSDGKWLGIIVMVGVRFAGTADFAGLTNQASRFDRFVHEAPTARLLFVLWRLQLTKPARDANFAVSPKVNDLSAPWAFFGLKLRHEPPDLMARRYTR